jgi:hypothetical protein
MVGGDAQVGRAQAGITLFRNLLEDVFGENRRDRLPDRVLPVSTVAPLDPIALFSEEIEEVARLLKPGTRRRTEAAARLRALAIVDGALRGEKLQPGEGDLRRLGEKVARGGEMAEVFPGITSVDFVTEGSGATLNLRITKKEGIPVHLVPEGTEGASVVAIKRVNELDFYNLSHAELSGHLGLTAPKTTAAVRYLDLEGKPDCFREVKIGQSSFKRYSQHAITAIREALENVSIEEIWQTYRAKRQPCSTGVVGLRHHAAGHVLSRSSRSNAARGTRRVRPSSMQGRPSRPPLERQSRAAA